MISHIRDAYKVLNTNIQILLQYANRQVTLMTAQEEYAVHVHRLLFLHELLVYEINISGLFLINRTVCTTYSIGIFLGVPTINGLHSNTFQNWMIWRRFQAAIYVEPTRHLDD